MILYLVETFPCLSERFIAREIIELRQAGSPIEVLAFRKEDGLTPEAPAHYISASFSLKQVGNLKKLRFVIRHLGLVAGLAPVKGLASMIHFLRLVKYLFCCFDALPIIASRGVTHLHAHFANMPTDLALLLSKLTQIPYSFSAHAHDIYTQAPQRIDRKLEAARFMGTCTGHNFRYFQNRLSPKNLHKVNHVYHGIPLEDWPLRSPMQAPNGPLKLLTVARLQEKKGLIYLCKAAQLLAQQGVDFQLDIAGDGPPYHQLQKFIEENRLNAHITLRGRVHPESIKTFYEEAGIFILPAIRAKNGDQDGLPNVLLEALAKGVPVITTPISGINELISADETGLIVPPQNAEAIAEAVIKLKADQQLYQRLVTQGRARVEQFNIDDSTRALQQLFMDHAS